ncbi:MAG: riboflavin synthase [Candidatus Marinimicrobia bacterium]|nr:riboflavin synthase [Candidatus Neomarinimicrobiota bacterium]|tara:strand:- start:862 stop:1518 length:657 start_codon:yes stop_codon:yes gene_type:complete
MFTGIVETLGIIDKIIQKEDGKTFIINAPKVMDDLDIGDSISVNGVCLTVVKRDDFKFHLNLVSETLKKSNLGDLKELSKVNLERALTLSTRLGGHMLQGHIETIGVIVEKNKIGEGAELVIAMDPKYLKYCIPKGSIALDGISLTIASLRENFIKIAIIPHTLENTNLGIKDTGDSLNIETDIIGKYIERLINIEDIEDDYESNIYSKLRSWGFGET